MVIIMKMSRIGIILLIVVAVGSYYYFSKPKATTAWNPHLETLSVSSVGEATYTKPSFLGTVLTDYTVTFQKSKDSVTYQFKIVNDSDFSAELTSLVKSIPKCKGSSSEDKEQICNHLEYSVKNEDGTELTTGTLLAPNSYKRVKLIIGYTGTENPKKPVTVENLDVDFLFKKGNN